MAPARAADFGEQAMAEAGRNEARSPDAGDEEVDERLEAIRETGLSAAADPGMDRFARLVAEIIGVPVSLVSLVEPGRQIFPGMIGLDDPWAAARETPLTHSLCQHVVSTRAPLILDDVRNDDRTRDSLAIMDLGVVGYAGMPLTDSDGHVLGSLCAIDTRPRQWTQREQALLEDLAAACSAELRLRVVSRQRERARREADDLAGRYRGALNRSQLLLRAAGALAEANGLAEVREQVRDLVTSDLQPSYVGLVLAEGDILRRLVDATDEVAVEVDHETYRLDSAWPSARATRENHTVVVNDEGDLERDYGAEALAAYRKTGLGTAVSVPLPGTVIPLGVLVLGWDHVHEIDIIEQALLASLAGYTARAVERALFLDNRVNASRQMQQALLTELPEVGGLELAAVYRPAAETDLVGGDWYDAYPLSSALDGGDISGSPARVAVSVGDITGHDLHAATLMGQVRSMLRQADLDHPGQGPTRVVTAMEHANRALDIGASGTLVHAHLRPLPPGDPDGGAGAWELTWTNAGHPPPLLLTPDGAVHRLDEHDILFHPALGEPERTEHVRVLPAGTVLLLYTDGLVEDRGNDIYAAVDRTSALLAARAGRPLHQMLAEVAQKIAGPSPADDIALFALRVHPPARRPAVRL
jgi:serine phosphatase RsbU (regulator of sigma subunit)